MSTAVLSAALVGVLGISASGPALAAAPAAHGSTGVTIDETVTSSAAPSPSALLAAGIIPADPRQYTAYQLALTGQVPDRHETGLRVATFETGLSRTVEGQLAEELSGPGSVQARQVADTIQRVRPDVVLLTGIDLDEDLRVAAGLQTNYLSVSGTQSTSINYPYVYSGGVNTGIDSGADLDNDGMIGGPGDSLGYGAFPGQAGMLVLSRYPLDTDQARTFQDFRWQDMPDSALPADEYTDLEASVLRLSSSGHWDVPVRVNGRSVHLLVSDPSAPQLAPAGAERHSDEVSFWTDYVAGESYPVDDAGVSGGLPEDTDFLVLGSLGEDPSTTDQPGAVAELLAQDTVQDTHPSSQGSLLAGAREDTAVVPTTDGGSTTARMDYVLPSASLTATGSGVFWPGAGQPGATPAPAQETLDLSAEASLPVIAEHRMVWVDVDVHD